VSQLGGLTPSSQWEKRHSDSEVSPRFS
jgi:hypothetical protein